MFTQLFIRVLVWALLGTLLSSCTRKVETSKLSIQLPKKLGGQLANKSASVGVFDTSVWEGSTSQASEINCFLVFVGSADAEETNMNFNSCKERSTEIEKVRFGPYGGAAPAGTAIEIEVPSGPNRKIFLLGTKAEAGACKDFHGSGPEKDKHTFPRILAETTQNLEAGDVEVTMTMPSGSITGKTELDLCQITDQPPQTGGDGGGDDGNDGGGGEGTPFVDSLTFANSSNFSFDSSKIEFTGGRAQLVAIDQTDDEGSVNGFGGGTTAGTGAGASLQLNSADNESDLSSPWTPAKSNLVAHWKLDNNFNDSIGSFNGTAVGDATFTGTDKRVGTHAGTFDGTGDYVDAATSGFDGNFSTDYTINAWFRVTNMSGTKTVASFRKSGSVQDTLFSLQVNASGSQLCGHFGQGSNTGLATTCSSTGVLAANVWYMATIKRTGSTVQVLMNSEGMGSAGGSFGTFNFTGAKLLIGADGFSGSPNNEFEGQIDEVGIWNTALSSEQIRTLYRRQYPKFAGSFESRIIGTGLASAPWSTFSWKTPAPFGKLLTGSGDPTSDYSSALSGLESNLIGSLPMDESSWSGTADEVLDISGNGNHGTSQNGAVPSTRGKIRRAGQFDGTNDNIDLGTNWANGLNGSSGATTSFWMHRMNTTSTQFAMVIAQGANDGIGGVNVSVSTDKTITLLAKSQNGDAPQILAHADTASHVNRWVHVSHTIDYSSGNTKLYINGELATSATKSYGSATYNSESPSGKDRIGAKENASNEFFNGLIDNVQLWGRELSATEIKQVYLRTANNVLFQVRSCDDAACSGESFAGPDGTAETFFDETHNNSSIDSSNVGIGNVLTTSPNLSFSDFTGISIANNRFFQYRAILESDDQAGSPLKPLVQEVKVGNNHFADTSPTVTNLTPLNYSKLTGFTDTSPNSCQIGYQLSPDGTNFFFFDGATWSTATNSSQTTVSGSVSANLDLYNTLVGAGGLRVRAFLHSDGNSQCSLDNLDVSGEN